MNIAILCFHRIGGSGIVAYEIGKAMAEEKGHNIHFIGLEPPFRLKKNKISNICFHKIFISEYPVFNYKPYTLSLASQLVNIIEKYNIDIIHSHYALPFAISAILAKNIVEKKIKTVTTLHGTDITTVGLHPGMKNITKYAIMESDNVTAVSNYLKNETENLFNIESGSIRTIYNFVNLKNFKNDKNNIHKKSKKKIIIHISNLRKVKNPLDVINIFFHIHKNNNYELHIVGEGPYLYNMQDLCDKLKISNKVKFLGVCSNVASLLNSSHLMLLPSEQESFGLVALEAMACGVPVIASEVGGLPEVIEHNYNGFLFKPGDIKLASELAKKTLNNKILYDKLSNNAYFTAKNKFSKDKIINKYEEIYMDRDNI